MPLTRVHPPTCLPRPPTCHHPSVRSRPLVCHHPAVRPRPLVCLHLPACHHPRACLHLPACHHPRACLHLPACHHPRACHHPPGCLAHLLAPAHPVRPRSPDRPARPCALAHPLPCAHFTSSWIEALHSVAWLGRALFLPRAGPYLIGSTHPTARRSASPRCLGPHLLRPARSGDGASGLARVAGGGDHGGLVLPNAPVRGRHAQHTSTRPHSPRTAHARLPHPTAVR